MCCVVIRIHSGVVLVETVTRAISGFPNRAKRVGRPAEELHQHEAHRKPMRHYNKHVFRINPGSFVDGKNAAGPHSFVLRMVSSGSVSRYHGVTTIRGNVCTRRRRRWHDHYCHEYQAVGHAPAIHFAATLACGKPRPRKGLRTCSPCRWPNRTACSRSS